MPRSHPRHDVGIIALVALVLAACEDGATAPLEPTVLGEPVPAGPLAVVAPAIRQADLVQFNATTTGAPPASGAMLTDIPDAESLQIRAAKTTVGFYAGQAYAEGSHEYTGNLGRITTTVHLAFEDQHVVSRAAVEQEWTWLPLSVWRKIRAIVAVDTDKTCGLSVSGVSQHETSGAYFDLNEVREIPGVTQTSQASTLRQPSCGHQVSDQAPAELYDSPPEGMTCLYLITYDRETYKVVDVELLGCSTSGTLF